MLRGGIRKSWKQLLTVGTGGGGTVFVALFTSSPMSVALAVVGLVVWTQQTEAAVP